MCLLRYGRAISAISLLWTVPLALAAFAQMRHTSAARDSHHLTTAVPAPATVANPIMTRRGILAYHAHITDDGQARDCRIRGNSIA